jgi:hypothetical protein
VPTQKQNIELQLVNGAIAGRALEARCESLCLLNGRAVDNDLRVRPVLSPLLIYEVNKSLVERAARILYESVGNVCPPSAFVVTKGYVPGV